MKERVRDVQELSPYQNAPQIKQKRQSSQDGLPLAIVSQELLHQREQERIKKQEARSLVRKLNQDKKERELVIK